MEPTSNNIAQELCNYLRQNILEEGVEIKPDSVFSEMGIDSYSIVELVLFIERKYGVEIPDEQLTPQNLRSAMAMAKCTFQLMNS